MKREKGTLVRWNNDKGYGFIRPHNENEDVFLHVKSLPHYQRRPKTDDILTYEIGIDENQKRYARYAKIKGFSWSLFTIFWLNSLFLFGAYVYFVFKQTLTFHPIAVYVAMSLITILAYSRDKNAAQSGKWRTSEYRLHFYEILGGWPGALLAQRCYHHKSKKISYQIFFWMIVTCHCLFWYHFLTHQEMYQPYQQLITEKARLLISQGTEQIMYFLKNIIKEIS